MTRKFRYIGQDGAFYKNNEIYDVSDSDVGHPKILDRTGNSRVLHTSYFNSNFIPLTRDDKYNEFVKDLKVVNPETVSPNSGRVFESGASRDSEEGKLDFDGFLSPSVLKSYAEYMHENRKMKDGTMRDSDNWQKGIPKDVYRKSMWRHFFDVWASQREKNVPLAYRVDYLNALLFNVMGLLHEELKDS